MVDKVIESIDFKHNAYLGRAAESEFIGRLDKDFEAMRQKRKEIQQQIEKEDLRPAAEIRAVSGRNSTTQPAATTSNAQQQQVQPQQPSVSREAPARPAAPAEPKRPEIDEFDDLDF